MTMPPRNARTPAPSPAPANAAERSAQVSFELILGKMEEVHAAEMTQKNRQIAQLMALTEQLFTERDELREQLNAS